MRLLAANRGSRLALLFASWSLLGCSAVLGYESDYDDSRDRAAGSAGSNGGGASGQGQGGAAGAIASGGKSGAAGAITQGGASGQGQGGASGQGQSGASGQGQSGASGQGQSGAGGAQAGAAGQSGGNAGTGGQSGAAGQGGGQGGVGGQSGAGQGGAAGLGGSGQAGSLSGGSGGSTGGGGPGGSGGAGQSGTAGVGGSSSTGGNGGATGGSAGATGGSAGAGGLPACIIATAPTTTCGDVLTARDNCGACGLSCGPQGECLAGRCVVDPVAKAPYARQVGYFGLPLAALNTTNSDRLLYRTQMSVPSADPVDALYDSSSTDDAPLLKRLGTNNIKVGAVDRPVNRWKSARFVPGTSQVLAVASVRRIPDEYPQDRVLVSLDRSTGAVLQTFQLAGDGGAWADTRPPVGGMIGAQDTGDVVAIGQKRGVVWDFIEGPTGGAVLRGFPVSLTGTGPFDTAIEPRYAIAASIVAIYDYAYFLSQASMNAPFKLKTVKLEVGAPEIGYGDTSVSFVHPTSMAIVPGTLFVADAGGNPAGVMSPNGKLYRYDISITCTRSQPQPVVVAQNLERLIQIAADDTHVYTLEVRAKAGSANQFENVLRRRFHDGTGVVTLLVEERPGSFALADDGPERAERLAKGFVLGKSYGKPMIFFGLGSDPAEYREPNDYLLGLPR